MITFDLDAAFSKLGEMVAKYGPQAVELAAQIKQIDSIARIAWGGLGLILIIVAIFWSIHWWKKAETAGWSREAMKNVGTFPSLLVGGFGAITVVIQWFNIWNWVGVFNPKLALAHDIWVKLTQVVNQ